MQDKVSQTLPKQQAKYKRYFDKMSCTLIAFTIGQQVYVKLHPLALIAENIKTSVIYNMLPARSTELFKVMDLRSHIIKIDKDGIPKTISFESATPVPTKAYVTTRISLNPNSF